MKLDSLDTFILTSDIKEPSLLYQYWLDEPVSNKEEKRRRMLLERHLKKLWQAEYIQIIVPVIDRLTGSEYTPILNYKKCWNGCPGCKLFSVACPGCHDDLDILIYATLILSNKRPLKISREAYI